MPAAVERLRMVHFNCPDKDYRWDSPENHVSHFRDQTHPASPAPAIILGDGTTGQSSRRWRWLAASIPLKRKGPEGGPKVTRSPVLRQRTREESLQLATLCSPR